MLKYGVLALLAIVNTFESLCFDMIVTCFLKKALFVSLVFFGFHWLSLVSHWNLWFPFRAFMCFLVI